MFNPGDLLECIANDVNNPNWVGIPPVVGNYYTWRGDHPCFYDYGYVEEIVSPITSSGNEAAHAKRWYRKVEDNVDIKALMEETELQEV